MNPCPCGYYGHENALCNCTMDRVEKYRAKISGPLMDRIDLHVDVPALTPGALSAPRFNKDESEHHDAVSDVACSQQRMRSRSGKLNAHLSSKEVEKYCVLASKDRQRLDNDMQKLSISARGYYKILKIARTIADLVDEKQICTHHLVEALGYRRLDRYKIR